MEDLQSLLDNLAANIRAVDDMEGRKSPPAKRRQYPPAKESELVTAEKRLGLTLPPSYAAFLRIHNGWEGINAGDISIIGISGDGYALAKKEFDRYVQMVEKQYRSEGPDYAAQLRSRELKEPSVMYLPHHIPVALNYNGSFWVIDRNRRSGSGEYEIARVDLGDEVRKRYKTFAEFINDLAKRVSSELPPSKRAKGKSGSGGAKKTSVNITKTVRKK